MKWRSLGLVAQYGRSGEYASHGSNNVNESFIYQIYHLHLAQFGEHYRTTIITFVLITITREKEVFLRTSRRKISTKDRLALEKSFFVLFTSENSPENPSNSTSGAHIPQRVSPERQTGHQKGQRLRPLGRQRTGRTDWMDKRKLRLRGRPLNLHYFSDSRSGNHKHDEVKKNMSK